MKIRKEAVAAYEYATQKTIKRSARKSIKFEVGQKVWLEARNIKLPGNSKKITTKREGPFKITKVMGLVTYELKLPKTWCIHNMFHANLLSPFMENEIHRPAYPEPPPDQIAGEDEYEVDQILKHKGKKGHEHQLTLTNRRPMPETNRGKGGAERKHVHCFALYIQHGRWGTRRRYLPVLTW